MELEAKQMVKRGPGRPPKAENAMGGTKKRGRKPRPRPGGGLIAKAVAKQLKAHQRADAEKTKRLVQALVSKELKRTLKSMLK